MPDNMKSDVSDDLDRRAYNAVQAQIWLQEIIVSRFSSLGSIKRLAVVTVDPVQEGTRLAQEMDDPIHDVDFRQLESDILNYPNFREQVQKNLEACLQGAGHDFYCHISVVKGKVVVKFTRSPEA